MQIDLALPGDPSQPSPTGAQTPPATQYPSLSIQGPAAAQLGAGRKPGDEIKAEVTFRVVDVQDGQVDLEAENIDTGEEEAEQPEEDGGQALDSYLSQKGGATGPSGPAVGQ